MTATTSHQQHLCIPRNPRFASAIVRTWHRQEIVWKSVDISGNEFEYREMEIPESENCIPSKINLDALKISSLLQ